MAGTFPEVREGLATILGSIADLNVYSYWPDTPNPPGVIVLPTGGDQHTTFATRGSFFFDLTVFAQIGSMVSAQQRLDSYLSFAGPLSIQAILEAEPTLNGAAEGLLVRMWRDYRSIDVNGTDFLRAIVPVEVWVRY